MANGLLPVKPGDLITAQAFNDLLTKIAQLEQAIAALGGTGSTGALAITGRIPPAGPYRIGDTLTILGQNFQYAIGAARVFLNAIPVLDLLPAASSNTQLTFVIPPVPGVVEPATEVTLRVLNQTEEVTAPLLLRPALPTLFGDVDVNWLDVDPTTFNPNDPVTFGFRITSRASQSADFLIDPIIAVASGQAIWQSRVQVRNAAQTVIPDRRITLAPLEQRLFEVHITQVPAGTAGTPFTLTVNATAGTVTGTSGALAFEVGQAVEPPDNTIILNIDTATPTTALVGDTVTASIAEPAVRVRFNAEFEIVGVYDLTLTTSPATTNWTVNRFINTPASFNIQASNIPPGGRAARVVEITIDPTAGASAAGRVEVRLQRQGNTNSQVVPLNLSLGA